MYNSKTLKSCPEWDKPVETKSSDGYDILHNYSSRHNDGPFHQSSVGKLHSDEIEGILLVYKCGKTHGTRIYL